MTAENETETVETAAPAEAVAETAAEAEAFAGTAMEAPMKAVEEARAKTEAWFKETGEKAREAALDAAADFKTSAGIALEGEKAAAEKMFSLVGAMMEDRAAAATEVLKAGDVKDALSVEQAYARKAAETFAAGMKELVEIRTKTFKDFMQPFADRASAVMKTA